MERASNIEVGDLLNAQCAKIDWSELERHYARGTIVRVARDLDLIDVARQIVADNKSMVAHWLESGRIANASPVDAKRWQTDECPLWAVVCAPWVLVQEAE